MQPNENSHVAAPLPIHVADAMSSFLPNMMRLHSPLAIHSLSDRTIAKRLKPAFKMVAITMTCSLPMHQNREPDKQCNVALKFHEKGICLKEKYLKRLIGEGKRTLWPVTANLLKLDH